MKRMRLLAIATGLLALSACATFPTDTRVADYCADPGNSDDAVCQLSMEIEGNRTALSETSLSLSEARQIADTALESAERAQSTAETANRKADEALRRADAALRPDDLDCETRIIQKTDIGTCRPGYTVMSCTQTRYTYRAGGPSILREINDEQCRFHDRVLEMRVRCCRGADTGTVGTPVPLSGGTTRSTPRSDVPTSP